MDAAQISVELKEKMDQTDWQSYWPGFKPVAFCIYDHEKIYLFNHPVFPISFDEPCSFLWEEQFVGDTLILYKDYPTAIVNVDRYPCLNHLYSILVHELFHGYQALKDEKRFPDELTGVKYPLQKENIELRTKERICLEHAYSEKDPAKRLGCLQAFVNCRRKREALLQDLIEYEYLIETVEGPAWYVELQSLMKVSGWSFEDAVSPYRNALLDQFEANLHLRKSCYSSGLYLCLILDELKEDWKDDFMQSGTSLYEYFSQWIEDPNSFTKEPEVCAQEVQEVYEYVRQQKQAKIEEFEQVEAYKLTIEGDMKATFFDPMNMVNIGDKLLHRYFVKLEINQNDYLINQPALVYYRDNLLHIFRLQLNLQHKPQLQKGVLTIKGIGEFKGEYTENGAFLHLKLPPVHSVQKMAN